VTSTGGNEQIEGLERLSCVTIKGEKGSLAYQNDLGDDKKIGYIKGTKGGYCTERRITFLKRRGGKTGS